MREGEEETDVAGYVLCVPATAFVGMFWQPSGDVEAREGVTSAGWMDGGGF